MIIKPTLATPTMGVARMYDVLGTSYRVTSYHILRIKYGYE